MAEITIGIRDTDLDTLKQLAEQQWRTPEQQASALIEQTLAQHRARAAAPPRSTSRRTNGASRNGVHGAQTLVAAG